MNEQQLTREKTAFIYSSALERGDFATVTAVLAQAEKDPVLERMLLELNAAQQEEMAGTKTQPAQIATKGNGRARPSFPKIEMSKTFIWQMGGVMTVVLILTVMILTLLGPPIGNSFSRISSGLEGGNNGSSFDRPSPGTLATIPPSVIDNTQNATPVPEVIERLIVRNGSINMVVEDPHTIRRQIDARVANMAGAGAFVVASDERDGENSLPVVYMAIRVPPEQFDETMNWLASLALSGFTPIRTETAQDVTEEYVDLQTRLETMIMARDRLLEFMQNAETTAELLQLEAQITNREKEIEALRGRIQYLEQSDALSLIEIELRPFVPTPTAVPTPTVIPVDNSWQPGETVQTSVASLIDTIQTVVDIIIVLGITRLPWLIVLTLTAYLVARFIWRPLFARQQGYLSDD